MFGYKQRKGDATSLGTSSSSTSTPSCPSATGLTPCAAPSSIWATHTLRDHLLRTLNERRLAERGLDEARQTLDLLARTLSNQELVDDTGRTVLELIQGYADTGCRTPSGAHCFSYSAFSLVRARRGS